MKPRKVTRVDVPDFDTLSLLTGSELWVRAGNRLENRLPWFAKILVKCPSCGARLDENCSRRKRTRGTSWRRNICEARLALAALLID